VPEFPQTSHSLIARVKDLSDAPSWAEFLAIYQPVVFRMARRRGLQDADAMDVSQQIFLSIANSIDGWEADESRPPFRAWLTTVARNAITKSLTRRPRDVATGTSSVDQLLSALPDDGWTRDELAKETRREVVHCVSKKIRNEFSESVWQSFYRTAIQGEAIADVAQSLGCSTGSIYVARFRVIARLKEKVAEITNHWDLGELTHDD
tara:strand:+ start:543699 stop:544319 length:621 start_codon:yes stop_codon:yes gene_type:complete